MKKSKLAMLTTIFIFSIAAKAGLPPDEGKTIFASRCAACHNVNKQVVGPALAGIDNRRSIEWIINFVHSSQTLVKSGDIYAAALFAKFNKVQMPDHKDLTSDNIKNIVEYIKSESKLSINDNAPFAKPVTLIPRYMPLSLRKDYLFFVGYIALVAILVATFLFAVRVKSVAREHQKFK